MVNQERFNNLGELTPFLKNVIIISSLFVAVLIVLIVVYNVVSIDIETKELEDTLDLNIIKNSVKLDDGVLKLSVSGKLRDLELAKVKFIISDGTNEKDISLDAEGFETQKSFEINLKELGIDYTKKLIISIVPIIKKLTGEKELKITDKISLNPEGIATQEEIPITEKKIPITEKKISATITSCDKCGGLFGKGCDKLLCHSISERCYYKGGFTRGCASCSKMTCEQYKTQEDCSEDRCKLFKCTSSNGKCNTNPDCGDSYINSSIGETCDPPQLSCNPAYGTNCTYCGSGCNYVNLKGGSCGDSILNGNEQCDNGILNTNIPCVPVYGGSCSYCDTSCITKSVVGEKCGDGVCQSSLGETCSSCISDCACSNGGCCVSGACTSLGTCNGEKICFSGSLIDHCGDSISNCGETCSSCAFDITCTNGGCCLSGSCNAVGTCSGNSICSLGNWITPCGNGICDCSETYSSCPADCLSTCGDSQCASGETPASCPIDCVGCGDGVCASGETCASCVADCKKCNGETCTLGTQCSSGNCKDSYCCDASCTGNCKSCSTGTCSNLAAGTSCGADHQCDGSGNCVSVLPTTCSDCGIGWLNPCDNAECLGLGDCYFVFGFPSSHCYNKKALGGSCGATGQCLSGNCVDGVCCSTSSCSTCKACNLNGLGTCSNIPNQQDPAEECSPKTCTNYISGWSGNDCKKLLSSTSRNGMCNGAGACYTSVADSCTGVGATSASCGSSGCKKTSACVTNALATLYDSVSEICYTSSQQSCSSGYACDGSGTCVSIYTYSWFIGDWGTCSVTCGGGTQTRTVYCKRSDGASVADSYCTGTKPDVSQSCNPQACPKANGEICTLGTECQSTYCYIDNDNDRYSPLLGTKTCESNSQLTGTDCDDNNINIWQLLSCYTDGDSDSYGAGSASSTCTGATCSVVGKVSQGGDCYDSNANAKPGQTQYFTTNRGDGNYDYNCDGTQDNSNCWNVGSCSLSGVCGGTNPGYAAEIVVQAQDFACGAWIPGTACSFTSWWIGAPCYPQGGQFTISSSYQCNSCGGVVSTTLIDYPDYSGTCACK